MLLVTSKGTGLEVNAEKTKCMFMSCEQTAGQNHNIKTGSKSFECVAKFKYMRKTLTSRYCIHEEINDRLYSGNACNHLFQGLPIGCPKL
jgi:hypothetical protein